MTAGGAFNRYSCHPFRLDSVSRTPVTLLNSPKERTCLPSMDYLNILDLEQLENNLFRGRSPQNGWQRVYRRPGRWAGAGRGGAHGRSARTADAFAAPSCCRATRKCRSSTRWTASATVAASPRAGWWRSSTGSRCSPWPCPSTSPSRASTIKSRCPDVPPPEELASEEELKARLLPNLPEVMRSYWEYERPIELRPVIFRAFSPPRRASRSNISGSRRAGRCRTISGCTSVCWPMRRTFRCWIRRWSRMAA